MKLSIQRFFILTGALLPNLLQAQDALYIQKEATVSIQPGALVAIQGNVRLDDGSLLKHNGVIEVSQGLTNTVSNWTDLTLKSYHYGYGRVAFTSNFSQSIASSNTFGQLEVDNNGLDLETSIAADQWIMVNGKVNTQAYRATVLQPTEKGVTAPLSNSGFKKSWFNGTLRRHLSPSTVNRCVFPVGNQQSAYIAELDNLMTNPLNVQYVDISFETLTGSNKGLSTIEGNQRYEAILNDGAWTLSSNTNTVSGSFDIRLCKDGFATNTSKRLGIIMRPLNSLNVTDWFVPQGSTASFVSNDHGVNFINRKHVSSFGQISIGVLADAENALLNKQPSAVDKTIITASPNPVINQLRLYTEKPINGLKGYISNSNGLVIKTFIVQSRGIIDVSSLQPGTYLVTIPDIDGPGKHWQQKFILIK